MASDERDRSPLFPSLGKPSSRPNGIVGLSQGCRRTPVAATPKRCKWRAVDVTWRWQQRRWLGSDSG
ncbi:hypothetical protein V6Z12_A07G103300 [Gossypium hirsutum]